MRSFWLSASMLFVLGFLAGCGDDGGDSTATPANPQAGLDAVKKLQGLPKATEKGLVPATGVESEKK
jgi:hypothetical protein